MGATFHIMRNGLVRRHESCNQRDIVCYNSAMQQLRSKTDLTYFIPAEPFSEKFSFTFNEILLYIALPMRKEKDNTRRIGGLLLDALMLSFIVSFSLADVRIVDVYPDSACHVTQTNEDLILIRELDAVCTSFVKQISQAQPALIFSLDSILKSPLLADAGLVVLTSTQQLYNTIYTNTTINAP